MDESSNVRGLLTLAETKSAHGLPTPCSAAEVQAELVSVVIPCYNEGAVLARTLEHLWPHRDSSGLEFIVSDDSSRDDSLEIARAHGCRAVESDGAPRSAARARNRGAAVARGGLLVFIDADILIEAPERFVAGLRGRFRDPRLLGATVSCRVYPELESGWDRAYHRIYDDFTWACNVVGVGTAGGWCQAVRRQAFVEIGGYDPRFTSGQDVDLFFRLSKRGRTRLLRGLKVLESPRRYRKEGLLRTAVRWLLNGVWVCVFRRPFLKHYPPVR